MISKFITSLLAITLCAIPTNHSNPVTLSTNQVDLPVWENSQTFTAEDGNSHTVYWAKGLNMPTITTDPALAGKEGYFDIKNELENGEKYNYFATEYNENHGYYDINKRYSRFELNKGNEKNQCYLGSSTNIIHWWLDQNKPYVSEYLKHLKANDGFFEIDENTRELIPFDEHLWKDIIYKSAPLEWSGENPNYIATEMAKDPIIQNIFKNNYLTRPKGFWMDLVIDYFINGYSSYHLEDYKDQNLESEYENNKDKTGGFFAPIFGKRRLSNRHEQLNYNYLNDNIVEFITSGSVISVGHKSLRANSGHAITIWGAEKDHNGNLCRIYYTDTDDFDSSYAGDNNILYGMRSYGVKNFKNSIRLSNRQGPIDIDASEGAELYDFITINLGQDMFEKALAEPKDIVAPITRKANYEFVLNERPDDITLNIENENSGYYTYQWYEKIKGSNDKKLLNQTSKTLKPDTSKIGTRTYYCEITNWVNGKKFNALSNDIEITIIDGVIVHAAKPVITFNRINKVYNSYQELPDYVKISAYAPDGGEISYQWYYTNNNNGAGMVKLQGETNNKLNAKKYIKPLDNYFFCEVTNYLASANGDKYYTVKFSSKTQMHEMYLSIDEEDLNSLNKYANNFLNAQICGVNDFTSADLTIFNKMEKEYDSLTPSAKEILKSYNGDQYSDDPIARLIAKYDRIIYLHENEGFNDFMNRKSSPSFTYSQYLGHENVLDKNMNDFYILLAISGIIILTILSFATYKYKRKQK